MTSDPVKPESFRSHLPAILAAAAGTVLATVLGSLAGTTAGTITGMAIGSLVSGTCSWWAERGIRRSTAIAAARAEAIRARGRPLNSAEDAAVTQVAAAVPDQARSRRRWVVPVAVAAIAFVGCAVAVTLLEEASGKPLSALVQGKPGHGTTLGGGVSGGAAPASPTPASSVSPGPATTAPANGTATGGAGTSPAASPTPAVSNGGTRSARSTTPSAAPSVTATVPAPGAASVSATPRAPLAVR